MITIPTPRINTGRFNFSNKPKKATRPLSFVDFVSRVNPRYRWYKANRVLANVLQRVADDKLTRLMIFMHPRSGKSELVSRLFTAYYLIRHPERWVGLNSYGTELAYTLSRNARDNFVANGTSISDSAAAVKQWETGQGGGLWAAGVGGPILGKGFHLGVIDDPIKNSEDAHSLTIRQKHIDWYLSTFSTREEPQGAIIIIQQRWHESDLSGWLLSQEEHEPEYWHIVHYEAVKEDESVKYPPTCTVEPDWRQVGEALVPERYPADKLERIRGRIGSYYFASLYQQRPRPREGGMFKQSAFTIVDAVPYGLPKIRYWDKAGADEGKGDFTVGVLMSSDGRGRYYIEDVVRGQWTAEPRNRIIRQTAELDRQRGHVTIYIEQPPGLAKESTDAVIRELAGFSAWADRPRGDKVERAEPFAAQCEAGNVALVRGAWNKTYIDELTAFPHGANDDQVDASTGAFNKMFGPGLEVEGGDFSDYRG